MYFSYDLLGDTNMHMVGLCYLADIEGCLSEHSFIEGFYVGRDITVWLSIIIGC